MPKSALCYPKWVFLRAQLRCESGCSQCVTTEGWAEGLTPLFAGKLVMEGSELGSRGGFVNES